MTEIAYIETCPTCGERSPVHAGGCSEGSLLRASEIRPEVIEWLWTDRVPLGMVTVFGGFPGVGKSTILYDLAARTSRDDSEVLIATREDHLHAVVRPRLEAAGAKLERVSMVVADVTLPDEVGKIRDLIEYRKAALVVLDPLVAFIGDDVNTHRDHHVRRVLAPLGDVAEETRASIVVVIHTNKGTSADPLMRISGSVGFTGAARSVVVAAEDPNDDTRRILAVAKSNLAKFPSPLAYRLTGVDLAERITTSKVEWLGEAPEVDVRELLAVPDRRERKGDQAHRFLVDAGVETVARPAAELEAEAEAQGINYRTLRRAREDMGVAAWKDGFQGPTWWGPRPDKADKPEGTHNRSLLSPLPLPAETEGTEPKGDNPVVAGEGVRTKLSAEAFVESLTIMLPGAEGHEWGAVQLTEHLVKTLGERYDLNVVTGFVRKLHQGAPDAA